MKYLLSTSMYTEQLKIRINSLTNTSSCDRVQYWFPANVQYTENIPYGNRTKARFSWGYLLTPSLAHLI